MNKTNKKTRKNSLRWEYWNYSDPGSYFITILTKRRIESLGKIENGEMILSNEGKIVEKQILAIPDYHNRILLEEWVNMPNHLHLIITLKEDDFVNRSIEELPYQFAEYELLLFKLESINKEDENNNQLKTQYRTLRRKMLIPKIIGKLQMLASAEINDLNKRPGMKNWHRSYHDHVIRNEKSFTKIKNYIKRNPALWEKDCFFRKGNS